MTPLPFPTDKAQPLPEAIEPIARTARAGPMPALGLDDRGARLKQRAPYIPPPRHDALAVFFGGEGTLTGQPQVQVTRGGHGALVDDGVVGKGGTLVSTSLPESALDQGQASSNSVELALDVDLDGRWGSMP